MTFFVYAMDDVESQYQDCLNIYIYCICNVMQNKKFTYILNQHITMPVVRLNQNILVFNKINEQCQLLHCDSS